MSIKPTGLVQWALSGSGITVPTDAKKVIGWSGAEKPAAEYFNWFMNLTGEHLRYLSYDWIVDDDFVRGPTGLFNTMPPSAGQGLTAAEYLPDWNLSPTNTFKFDPNIDSAENAFGVLLFYPRASGFIAHALANPAGKIGSHDYLLEVIAKMPNRGASFGKVEVGLTETSSVGSQAFVATGPSGNWRFQMTYMGPSAAYLSTGMDLGVDPMSPTFFQKLCVERVGSTMTVDINGTRRAAFPAPAGAYVGSQAWGEAGIKVTCFGSTPEVYLDRLRLGVRR